jgi:O-antigen/teichoic acid export membrane protein
MSKKRIGVALGYISMAITNLSSFLITPLMLTVFGTSDFGVYRLVLSIMSYFALADLGLSNAIVRYVSEYKTKNDKDSEGKFIGLVIGIDLGMTILVLLASLFFYYYLPELFSSSFTNDEILLLEDLFILVVISGILTLFVNIASGILKSYEKFSVLKFINIGKTIVRVSLIVILLLLDFQAYEIVLVDVLMMCLVFIYSWFYCFKYLNVRPHFKNIDSKYSKMILSYSLIVFVDAIAYHFFWAADSFIIGVYVSASAIAVYSIGTLLANLFASFSFVISDVLMPEVVSQVASGADSKTLTDYMIKIGFLILAMPTLGFIFYGDKFITLWLGTSFNTSYFVALLILIPQMISALMDVAMYIMWAKNKHKIKSFVSLGICVVNIFATVYLVQEMGIIGAAISTSVSFVLGYIIFNSIYFQKMLDLNIWRFAKETFERVWIGFIISALGMYVISLFEPLSWLYLIIQGILALLIYMVAIWFFGMNSSEKAVAFSIANNINKFKK